MVRLRALSRSPAPPHRAVERPDRQMTDLAASGGALGEQAQVGEQNALAVDAVLGGASADHGGVEVAAEIRDGTRMECPHAIHVEAPHPAIPDVLAQPRRDGAVSPTSMTGIICAARARA